MRIKIDNKSTIVYLVHIIDDASRMIVGEILTFHDTAVCFQKVLKTAVKTYGIPKILYVDNGAPYANEQLSLICANLGIHLIHAKPYTPKREGLWDKKYYGTFSKKVLNCRHFLFVFVP